MLCSNCGKEISDDSKFCYSCGSKVEIKGKQDTVIDTPPPVVNQETPLEIEDVEEKTYYKESNKKESSSFLLKRGYGWFILLWIYGYYLSKSSSSYPVTGTSIIIGFMGLIPLLVFYFWLRNFLPKKGLFKMKFTPGSNTSFVSGVISFFLIGMLVSGSIGFISGHQKGKEISEFSKSYIERINNIKKQEIEYSKMMMSEPKTRSEIKDKLIKVDELKIFSINSNKIVSELINFFRETNSRYKKDKSVDEQINKLEKIRIDVIKTSIDSLDVYKKHLITGDERYLNQYEQEYERQQLLKDEWSKLVTNIYKSL